MAKEFDIYLRNHLMECDLLVYSIPYRDGISATNRLILEAALNSYILQKFAATQMGSVLTAHIDQMIKLCLEKLNMGVVLGATAELEAHGKLYLNNAPLIINTPAVETVEQMLNEVENGLVLTVDPLVTQVASSTGVGKFPLVVDASVSDTLKHSLLSLRSALVPNTVVTQVNQTDYINVDAPMIVGSTLQSLCYQLTFAASAAVEIVALVLGTEIRHSLGVWYSGTTLGSKVTKTWAQKFITAQTVTTIMQEATGTLIKVLYPDENVLIVEIPNMNIGMKRKRLLYEIDPLQLKDIDGMTLRELDYVILEE